ncbi:UNVERIFIED_CONTAM: Pentatricopeptide repeat-containing protein [Sesamum calycinum]|uniref:Pentatricopeptide repeat-containing protein n=1 Tax=Sesamum calycinum TaxID=2727403 RepID=A0AAW2SCW2_9LAMI
MILPRPPLRNSLKSLSNFCKPFQAFNFYHSSAVALDSGTCDDPVDFSRFQWAHNPFDKCLQRDISYYNHLLFEYSRDGLNKEAVKTYALINSVGVLVDGCTLSCILKVSASLKKHVFGKQIHCQCVKNGLFEDVSVGTSLVDMYVKNENLDDGKRVFEEIKEKNVVTWTSLLAGYAHKGMIQNVIETFCIMKFEGVQPNPFTFATVIGAFADEGEMQGGAQLHAMVIKSGFNSTRVVGNSLVSLYSKSGMIREARDVFDGIEFRDAVSWNGIIAGLIMNRLELDALQMFYRMRLAGVKFSETTFSTVVKLCTNLKELGFARQIHSQVLKSGFVCFDNIRTALMVCYMKVSEMDDAIKMFSVVGIAQTVVSWTAVIGGCCRRRMVNNPRTMEIYSCMVDLYSRAGMLDKAMALIDGGWGQLFGDSAAYVLLANLYAASGHWRDRAKVRKLMDERKQNCSFFYMVRCYRIWGNRLGTLVSVCSSILLEIMSSSQSNLAFLSLNGSDGKQSALRFHKEMIGPLPKYDHIDPTKLQFFNCISTRSWTR